MSVSRTSTPPAIVTPSSSCDFMLQYGWCQYAMVQPFGLLARFCWRSFWSHVYCLFHPAELASDPHADPSLPQRKESVESRLTKCQHGLPPEVQFPAS